jgi:hypothetical protein
MLARLCEMACERAEEATGFCSRRHGVFRREYRVEVVVSVLTLTSMFVVPDSCDIKGCLMRLYGIMVCVVCKKVSQLSYIQNELGLSAPSAKALSPHGLDAL